MRAESSNRMSRTTALLAASATFALAAGWLAYRAATLMNVPGDPDAVHWVMQDFRDAIYFPVRSLLDWRNPYDSRVHMATYPVGQTFPPYSPLLLLLHAPLGFLPLGAAQVIYLACNVILTVVLAYAVLRWTGGGSATQALFIAGVVLLSRPGQLNVLVGQPTLLLVAGAYLALIELRRRPWLAGLGLALTSLKPTYAVPLALLMLARGALRPVVIGGTVALVGAALAGIGPVSAAGGVGAFAGLMADNYAAFAGQGAADPSRSVTRIDVCVVLARLLGHPPGAAVDAASFAVVVGLGALAVRRADRGAPTDLALITGITCSTILAGVYQLSYNLVLLLLPLVAVLRGPRDATWLRPLWVRTLLSLVYGGVIVNYLASESAARLLSFSPVMRDLAGSLNSLGVLTLFAIYCRAGLRASVRAGAPHGGSRTPELPPIPRGAFVSGQGAPR